MSKEIERKFLVVGDAYREMACNKKEIIQGYLSRDIEATVRVRIIDGRAFLTVKSKNEGMVRNEWEYEIPVNDAREMLDLCCKGPVLRKTRYLVEYSGFTWEVDEFHGDRAGLIVAEVELDDASINPPLPSFVGNEVTGNKAYYNSNL